jgi:Cytochrome c554 and c-prime
MIKCNLPGRSLSLSALVLLILAVSWQICAQIGQAPQPVAVMPSAGGGPFSPSNARTEDGGLIATEAFFPAARCATCHQDTHRAWSQSLHRNAAREPFYRESVDILLRTRGIEPTRHCESCHTPVALFSGALTKENKNQQAPFTPLDDEGVTCTVCHSITEARPDGTGSFTIRRPALLAREDSSPIYGNFSDAEILADIPAHKRAVMRPLLRRPEFCSVCHKVTAPPTLNGYKQIRGFSAYDEWQQSGASLETVTPYYRREQRTDCRACHMPKIESHNDRAAKNDMIASHRWLGANTAAPLFYGQAEQAELVEEFLQKSVLNVDIFALKREATATLAAPLSAESRMLIQPGEEVTVEVVVANRNAAHSFPPEVRDLYEAWVEFLATDQDGRMIFHSGSVAADGALDESAHVYKTLILDQAGRPITRHQIWLTNIKAYDNTINAGRSDVVRFRFRLPNEANNSANRFVRLRARVNYRRFNQDYIGYVLGRRQSRLTVPIVAMAEAEVKLVPGEVAQQMTASQAEARRWNDYGIGLLEQAQYGAAASAFRQAGHCDPANSAEKPRLDALKKAASRPLRPREPRLPGKRGGRRDEDGTLRP